MIQSLIPRASLGLWITGLLLPAALDGQDIAARVRSAGNAEVRMTYATRAGVCGDGANAVALGEALYVYPSMESYGRWSGVDCERGDARVALTVRDGEVELVRTRVGGRWRDADGRVVDLGVVPAADAARYFLTLAETLDGRQSRNALLPAVIADSFDVLPQLRQIAERANVPREARRRAVHWLGILGDRSLVAPLERMARTDDGEDGIGEAALFALSRLPEEAGIPALIGIVRSDARLELRRKAIFWAGQGETQVADLVRLYDELRDDELKEHMIFVLSQREERTAIDKLMAIARNDADREMRKKALFWLGQKDDPAVTRMIADMVTRP